MTEAERGGGGDEVERSGTQCIESEGGGWVVWN